MTVPNLPASSWRVVELLAACPGVERVRLFGSRARGDHTDGSDVDLAIDAPSLTPHDRARLAADADEALTLYPFDLVWIEEAPESLRARIDADGVTLYDRQATATA